MRVRSAAKQATTKTFYQILVHEFFHTSTSCLPVCNQQYDYLILTRLRDNRIRKAGPNFLMFTSAGKSASVAVPKTFAKIKSSPSGTRRCLVSSFASDSLLTSHPNTCNFADKSSCVQPLRSRISRTCVPIKFSGNETFLITPTVAAPHGKNVRLRSQMVLVKREPFPQSSSGKSDSGHMKIIANVKRYGFFSHIGEASCGFAKSPISHLKRYPDTCLKNCKSAVALIRSHNSFPLAIEFRLDSKSRYGDLNQATHDGQFSCHFLELIFTRLWPVSLSLISQNNNTR